MASSKQGRLTGRSNTAKVVGKRSWGNSHAPSSGLRLDREGPLVILGNASKPLKISAARCKIDQPRRSEGIAAELWTRKKRSLGDCADSVDDRVRISCLEDGDVIQYAQMHADDSDTMWSGIMLAKQG